MNIKNKWLNISTSVGVLHLWLKIIGTLGLLLIISYILSRAFPFLAGFYNKLILYFIIPPFAFVSGVFFLLSLLVGGYFLIILSMLGIVLGGVFAVVYWPLYILIILKVFNLREKGYYPKWLIIALAVLTLIFILGLSLMPILNPD